MYTKTVCQVETRRDAVTAEGERQEGEKKSRKTKEVRVSSKTRGLK